MATKYNPKIVMDNLVLYVDAGNTKSYTSSSATTWTDISGSGNNATLSGATYKSDNGGCITFDGSNDYGYISSLDVPNRPFTASIWIKHETNLNSWQSYMGQDSSDSGNHGSLYFQKRDPSQSPGNAFSIAIRPDNSDSTTKVNGTTASLNVWTNLCGVVSSSDLKIYVNGELEGTTSNSNTMAPRTGNFVIGAAYYNGSVVDYFKGKMSTVMVYSNALTAAEVKQNFDAHKGRYGL